MKTKTKYLLRNAIIIIIWTIFAVWVLNIDLAAAHENEKYKHQPTGMRYGGGFIWGGIYRTFVDAEFTQCRDIIFTHDQMHVTDPFKCDANLKQIFKEK